jgi:hypothetical protein
MPPTADVTRALGYAIEVLRLLEKAEAEEMKNKSGRAMK